jgi:hypothetical protein
MALTACDKMSGELVMSDMESHTAQAQDTANLKMGVMTLEDYKARSDARTNGQVEARIKLYQQNCPKGDTIKMPSAWSYQVKELCDFSKSIVNLGNETLCVMK